jgi:hypothetical protein
MTSNDVIPPKRTAHEHTWQTLIEFSLAREPGSERLAVDRVVEAVQRLNLPAAHLGQLELTLARATLNAMERSHRYGSEAPLVIRVLIPENGPAIREADQAGSGPTRHQAPDGEIQQVGRPSSRGWGFFLIEKAVPDSGGGGGPVLELFLYPEGEKHGRQRR